ncbi:aspartate-alanine antiporter-like transporter [Shewanella subflava]|uniref:YidE/YbjL duplication domain-containing protein n=1 Tax=Shewanella subflava TaxID=2986476 RepID=A0ABT3I7Z1_9GAMM|nr:hypothetical protein [Shewanella subflava]MCW3172192.1 hypothetical protein [Shewanella subflava]
MAILEHIFTSSAYFILLITLVLGFVVGKINLGRFSLGTILSTLLVGLVVGLAGGANDPSLTWLFFSLFVYVVAYLGGSIFTQDLQAHQKSILIKVLQLCFTTFTAIAFVYWVFSIESIAVLRLAADHISTSDVIVFASALLPIIIATRKLPWLKKWYAPTQLINSVSTEVEATSLHDSQQINSVKNVVRRAFKVNTDSTVVGKTLTQLNTPAVEVVFELQKGSLDTDRNTVNAGDTITVTGTSNSLYYLEDNVLGTELPLENNIIEEHFQIVANQHGLQNSSLLALKNNLNKTSPRGILISRYIRKGIDIEITPDLIISNEDIIQVTGNDMDIKQVKHALGITNNSVVFGQVLFTLGIILAYLTSCFDLELTGVPLLLGAGGCSLITGLFIGWISHHSSLFTPVSTSSLKRLSFAGLWGFVAVSGLFLGSLVTQAVSQDSLKMMFVAVVVTILSQLVLYSLGNKVVSNS